MMLQSADQRLRSVINMEFFEDICQVILDSFFAEIENTPDILIGKPAGNAYKHVMFSRCKTLFACFFPMILRPFLRIRRKILLTSEKPLGKSRLNV